MSTTIAAIATPPGKGGLAVIRISGPDAFQLIQTSFKPRIASRNFLKPWTLSSGTIADPESGETFDDVVISVFKAPASYTGEDMVEISCHGSSAIAAAVLNLLLKEGAEPAGPGEFTRRAFENGKLDLSQAEAVALLTAAESEAERKLALGMLHGGMSAPLGRIRQALLHVLSGVELDLDFPEEEPAIPLAQTLKTLGDAAFEIENMMAAGQKGDAAQKGLTVVLAGPVNAGKSKLFNRLIGRDRAIVADEPGTTRDTLEGLWETHGLTVTLFDTAGLRKTSSIAETEAIRRSEASFTTADLILFIIDGTAPDPLMAKKLRSLTGETDIMTVWNKIDISDLPETGLEEKFLSATGSSTLFPVSAKTGIGIADLRQALSRWADKHQPDISGSALLLTLRQKKLLENIAGHIAFAGDTLRSDAPPECSVPSLRSAYDLTGEIIGDHIPPDVLNTIFSQFCIGK